MPKPNDITIQLCQDCAEHHLDFGAEHRCRKHPQTNYVTAHPKPDMLCSNIRTGPICKGFGKREKGGTE